MPVKCFLGGIKQCITKLTIIIVGKDVNSIPMLKKRPTEKPVSDGRKINCVCVCLCLFVRLSERETHTEGERERKERQHACILRGSL